MNSSAASAFSLLNGLNRNPPMEYMMKPHQFLAIQFLAVLNCNEAFVAEPFEAAFGSGAFWDVVDFALSGAAGFEEADGIPRMADAYVWIHMANIFQKKNNCKSKYRKFFSEVDA